MLHLADRPTCPTTEPEFLSPAQLAACLGISLASVYRRIADDTFPHARIGGLLRVPRTALENLIPES